MLHWRIFTSLAAGGVASYSAFFAWEWFKLWRKSDHSVGYALAATNAGMGTAICLLSIFWRAYDQFGSAPLNIGDFTILVPVLGYGLAAWLHFKTLALAGNYDLDKVGR